MGLVYWPTVSRFLLHNVNIPYIDPTGPGSLCIGCCGRTKRSCMEFPDPTAGWCRITWGLGGRFHLIPALTTQWWMTSQHETFKTLVPEAVFLKRDVGIIFWDGYFVVGNLDVSWYVNLKQIRYMAPNSHPKRPWKNMRDHPASVEHECIQDLENNGTLNGRDVYLPGIYGIY